MHCNCQKIFTVEVVQKVFVGILKIGNDLGKEQPQNASDIDCLKLRVSCNVWSIHVFSDSTSMYSELLRL